MVWYAVLRISSAELTPGLPRGDGHPVSTTVPACGVAQAEGRTEGDAMNALFGGWAVIVTVKASVTASANAMLACQAFCHCFPGSCAPGSRHQTTPIRRSTHTSSLPPVKKEQR